MWVLKDKKEKKMMFIIFFFSWNYLHFAVDAIAAHTANLLREEDQQRSVKTSKENRYLSVSVLNMKLQPAAGEFSEPLGLETGKAASLVWSKSRKIYIPLKLTN